MNKRTLLIVLSSLVWAIILGLLFWMFLKKNDPKTIDDVLKNNVNTNKIPNNVALDDYYLFPPSPIFDASKDPMLNEFYESSIKNKDAKIKQLIKNQPLFKNHEEIIQNTLNQILTE